MTKTDKETLLSLRREQEALEASISKKQERVYEILGEIRKINLKDYQQKLKKLGIKQDTILVGFDHTLGYHCDMIEVIQVVSSNPSRRSIDCVLCKYRVDDGDYSFHTSHKSMSVKQLTEWLNDHLVYTICASDFMLLLEQMAALKINYENVGKLPAFVETLDNSRKITLDCDFSEE